MRFKDRVVVVTGGGSGIGLAAAIMFAQEGAIVALNDIDEASAAVGVEAVRVSGGQAFGIPADVANDDAVKRAVAAVVESHGHIDVLVNNAGIATSSPAEEYPDWDRILNVNLSGPFFWSRAVAKACMISRREGTIVNVASVCGLVAIPNDAGYVAAKHGLIGLTRALAVEWAKFNIRVNCICPGFTETPILARIEAVHPGRWDGRRGRIPLGRGASPDEQAKAILFLASPDSSFCSGSVLLVDGGQTSLSSGWMTAQA